jgi:nitroreductase
MKEKIKKLMPASVFHVLVCMKVSIVASGVYLHDAVHFMMHSHSLRKKLRCRQLESKLWAQAHVIEKGMSLPKPRLGYGQAGIESLFGFCDQYLKGEFPVEGVVFVNAVQVLKSYVRFHEEHAYDVSDLKRRIDAYHVPCGEILEAGRIQVSLAEYRKQATSDFSALANSRHTIRSFSGEAVSEGKVRDALEIARKTPSACNRQCWRTYWVRSQEMKDRLLELQNGHRGFGDTADSFLVITADVSSFFGLMERHQSFIDGGLYAMTVLNALHYVGVGVCPLNWCVMPKKDRQLHQALQIPVSENVIMILALGGLPATIVAAKSVRKSVDETLEVR